VIVYDGNIIDCKTGEISETKTTNMDYYKLTPVHLSVIRNANTRIDGSNLFSVDTVNKNNLSIEASLEFILNKPSYEEIYVFDDSYVVVYDNGISGFKRNDISQ